jgi:hypothetical protein
MLILIFISQGIFSGFETSFFGTIPPKTFSFVIRSLTARSYSNPAAVPSVQPHHAEVTVHGFATTRAFDKDHEQSDFISTVKRIHVCIVSSNYVPANKI